jgi:hypothetical protein
VLGGSKQRTSLSKALQTPLGEGSKQVTRPPSVLHTPNGVAAHFTPSAPEAQR